MAAVMRVLVLPPRAPAAPRTLLGGVLSLSAVLPPRMRGRAAAELSASEEGDGFEGLDWVRAVLWLVFTEATEATDTSSSIKMASPAKLSSSSCACSSRLAFNALATGESARLDGLLERFLPELSFASTATNPLLLCRPDGGLLGTGELSLDDGRLVDSLSTDCLFSSVGAGAGGGAGDRGGECTLRLFVPLGALLCTER